MDHFNSEDDYSDYKDRQRQKDIAAEKLYSDMKDSLTPEQKSVLFNKKSLNGTIHGFVKTMEYETSGISITKVSEKQDPHAKRLYYDEHGAPEIADIFDLSQLDSREDVVRECIQSKGNLTRLIESFVFQDLRSYQTQLFTKFANLIISSDNPKLELQAILKAAGVELDSPESGERIAKEYGVTRQAVSKKTMTKKAKLGLPNETRDSKASDSRATYKSKNHRNTKI